MNDSGNHKIRTGILLSATDIHKWQFVAIDNLLKSGIAELSLFYLKDLSDTERQINHSFIFRLHQKTEGLVFGNYSDYLSYISQDVLDKIISPVNLEISINSGKVEISPEGCNKLKAVEPDLIINLSPVRVMGDILKIPRSGLWEYRVGNEKGHHAFPAGFIEVVTGNPVTDSALVLLNESGDEKTMLCNWAGQTYAFSTVVNRVNAFKRAAIILPRMVQGMYRYGNTFLREITDTQADNPGAEVKIQEYRDSYLTDLKHLLLYSKIIIRKVFHNALFFTKTFNWFILIAKKGDGNWEKFLPDKNGIVKLVPPRDRFWADPFIMTRDRRHYIFVEELPYKSRKGHISVLEIDTSGKIVNSGIALERPYHLSYPFVFEFGGSVYMLPETGDNKTIELYKCTGFPYQWDFVMNLMEGVNAKDSTLFYHNGKWWLFTSINESGIKTDYSELSIFYAEDLFSKKWVPHPANPVVSDIRTARCAGKIFVENDIIYRPSQDGAVRYGRALNLHQVQKLTESEYSETLLKKTEPTDIDSRYKGLHTLNIDGDYIALDAYTYRRRF